MSRVEFKKKLVVEWYLKFEKANTNFYGYRTTEHESTTEHIFRFLKNSCIPTPNSPMYPASFPNAPSPNLRSL